MLDKGAKFQAESTIQEALDLRWQLFGSEDPFTAASLNDLATVFPASGALHRV